MKTGLIYKIACDITNKCYVGQTYQKLEERVRQHLKDCKYRNYNSIFHKAIRKYGWKHFKVEVLEDNIPLKDLSKQEIFWAKKENALAPNGYTLVVGDKHKIVSEETKKKMSESQKGKIPWNKGKSSWCKGKHFSKEHKNNLSLSLEGIFVSEETKEKMSKNHYKRKVVLCYDLEGNFIKEYDSIRKAGKELNINHTLISRICLKKQNFTGNYIFKYKN